MDYIKIRFGNSFSHSGSKVEKTIEDMFRSLSPMFSLSERTWKPPMDICETADEIIILAEIAGVGKENMEVEINSSAVRICGQRDEIPRQADTSYRLAEIQYGQFERILVLPAPIDPEKVSATYTNGFLEIRMPKLQPPKTLRIPISEG